MSIYEALLLIKQIGFAAIPVPGTNSYMIETTEGKISWLKENIMLQLVSSLKNDPNHLHTALNEILY